MEKIKEYIFVDFFVYNKYININLPEIEITVAEYAITNSNFIMSHDILNVLYSFTYFLLVQKLFYYYNSIGIQLLYIYLLYLLII